MTIKRAIELAIEGGYQKYSDIEDFLDGKTTYHPIRFRFLDPLFWQCFGKVMGWKYPDGTDVAKYRMNDPKHTAYPVYLYHWHRLIDALAEGKTIEQFFESLDEK